MSARDFPELLDEWSRLDALLERQILRLRARYQLSLDEFRGLYISDEHVNQLIAAGNDRGAGGVETGAGTIALHRPPDSPVTRLGEALNLGPVERDLVVLALAPEIDGKYETIFAYLNDDVVRRWPTADLAARLFRDTAAPGAVYAALAADAPLTRLALVHAIDPPAGRPSMLNTGYKLARTAVHYLLGIDALPSELAGFARRVPTLRAKDLPIFSQARASHIRRLPDLFRHRSREASPIVLLVGADGADSEVIAVSLAHDLGRPLVAISLDAARTLPGWPEQPLAAMALHARLSGSVVYVEAGSALERPSEVIGILRALQAEGTSVLLACADDSHWRDVGRALRTMVVKTDLVDFEERRAAWNEATARAGLPIAQSTAPMLAGRFALSSRQVELAVEGAVDRAVLTGEASPDMEALIAESARSLLDQRLGRLATKVTMAPTWDDLVLPGPTRSRLRELASAVKFRHVVYAEWGFARRSSTGTGVKALFAGPSGTGKTMTAAVLAHELGFDLYRIDLSGVVSKYIGETEKNLDEIFRGARAGQAILFFDEADALFGKRSEVKDAHDRYANIEVAYLLQKLEEHDGVVILATNLKRNVDEAFARRMHYVIEFPLPDAAARETLWRGMFPPEVPMAPDVDCAFLARQFAISGGDIRNVALDAAFLAAENGRVVTMRELVRATARQLVKQGRLPSAGDFQEYHGWIVGGG